MNLYWTIKEDLDEIREYSFADTVVEQESRKKPVETPKQEPDDRLKQLVKQAKDDLIGKDFGTYYCKEPRSGILYNQMKAEKKSRWKTPGTRMITKSSRKVSEDFLDSVSRDIKKILSDNMCDIRKCPREAKILLEGVILKEFGRQEHQEANLSNQKLNEELDERTRNAIRTILDTLEDIQLGLVDNPVQAIRKLKETRW